MSDEAKTMYKVSSVYTAASIKAVQVAKETKHFVYIEGDIDRRGKANRTAKRGTYFDTWSDARDFIRNRLVAARELSEQRIAMHQRKIQACNTQLECVENMTREEVG